MKKATRLPDMFSWTDRRIENWLESHDTTEILKKSIQEQRIQVASKKQVKKHISLRIEPAYIEQAKKVAAGKGIGHQTLMRTFIIEGLTREIKT